MGKQVTSTVVTTYIPLTPPYITLRQDQCEELVPAINKLPQGHGKQLKHSWKAWLVVLQDEAVLLSASETHY